MDTFVLRNILPPLLRVLPGTQEMWFLVLKMGDLRTTFVDLELIIISSDEVSHWNYLPDSGNIGSVTPHKIVLYGKALSIEIHFEII
jgi:hypothetical protein